MSFKKAEIGLENCIVYMVHALHIVLQVPFTALNIVSWIPWECCLSTEPGLMVEHHQIGPITKQKR